MRLKAGDPVIFGRAGEEIAELEANGIEVMIVPGITSASAMAAALGISLTHRDHAHSVRFVTGHSRHGALPENLDWRGLTDPETTLVIYMGGETDREFAHRLIQNGRAASTPVVVMRDVSRVNETRWAGTLGDLAWRTVQGKSDQPVLIGIGHAFAACMEQRQCKTGIHAAPQVRVG